MIRLENKTLDEFIKDKLSLIEKVDHVKVNYNYGIDPEVNFLWEIKINQGELIRGVDITSLEVLMKFKLSASLESIPLKDSHIGKKVVFNDGWSKETGTLTSFNDRFVFINFPDDESGRGIACNPFHVKFSMK